MLIGKKLMEFTLPDNAGEIELEVSWSYEADPGDYFQPPSIDVSATVENLESIVMARYIEAARDAIKSIEADLENLDDEIEEWAREEYADYN